MSKFIRVDDLIFETTGMAIMKSGDLNIHFVNKSVGKFKEYETQELRDTAFEDLAEKLGGRRHERVD